MSAGQRPRTPEYFPRMNDRGGRRRTRRSAAREQPLTLGRFLADLGAACARIVDTFTYAMHRLPTRQQDYALRPAPMPRGLTNTLTIHDKTNHGARRSSEGTR